MSSPFTDGKRLCVELNCEKWYVKCLVALYGLRELGHKEAAVYLIEDVKAALIAHAADGRPSKSEMEKRIKDSEDEPD